MAESKCLVFSVGAERTLKDVTSSRKYLRTNRCVCLVSHYHSATFLTLAHYHSRLDDSLFYPLPGAVRLFSCNEQYKCLPAYPASFLFFFFPPSPFKLTLSSFEGCPQKLRLQTEVMEFYKATRWWQCPVLTLNHLYIMSHSTNT